jgi:hypothetical protein
MTVFIFHHILILYFIFQEHISIYIPASQNIISKLLVYRR